MPLTYTYLAILVSYCQTQTYLSYLYTLPKAVQAGVARPLGSGLLVGECENIPENLSVFGEFAKLEA